jgi:hypothetical protein
MITYRGIARGKTIELQEPLPFDNGQPLQVSVKPSVARASRGAPGAVRAAMHKPPHVPADAVAELLRAIARARLRVRPQGVFEE